MGTDLCWSETYLGKSFYTWFCLEFKTCRMFCFVSSFDTPDTSSIAMSALDFCFSICICFSLEFGVWSFCLAWISLESRIVLELSQ